MNLDDVMRLVIEAEGVEGIEEDGSMFVEFSEKQLMLFAALVAAAEREACAKVCEGYANSRGVDEMAYRALREADEAIRARGKR